MSILGFGFLYGYFYAFRDLDLYPEGNMITIVLLYALLAFLPLVVVSRPSKPLVLGVSATWIVLFYVLAFRFLRLVDNDAVSPAFLRWGEIMSFIILPLIILSVVVLNPLFYLFLLPQGDIARIDLSNNRLVYPRLFGSTSYPIGSDWKVLIRPFKSLKKRDRKVLSLGNARERHFIMAGRPEMISLIAEKLSAELGLEIVGTQS